MATPPVKTLLEAGSHFGHQTRRWNPKMDKFIFGVRGGVHIIDLTKTVNYLQDATKFTREVAEQGGKVLFVGTKRQAIAIVKDEATTAGQPYVTERWLGGMLTNFRTIQSRVKRLKQLQAGLDSGEYEGKYNKKEILDFTNERDHLARIFGGIQDMNELPKAVFVVDVVRDNIAVAEARNLNIPVIGIVDTNANPDDIDYPIPANDDAIKSIRVITHAIAEEAAAGAATAVKKAAEVAAAQADAEIEAEEGSKVEASK
ncbi:MAG TPA: 30S ribosomal protein S2 [Candidatus Saccharimonadales bacterium]|nr:30S ribosomal protein S2 [Candidatus Saccharimonadales bacterium]